MAIYITHSSNIATFINDFKQHMVKKIKQSLDNGKKCAGIFIDLRKAFDSISHKNLLKKLNTVGMIY